MGAFRARAARKAHGLADHWENREQEPSGRQAVVRETFAIQQQHCQVWVLTKLSQPRKNRSPGLQANGRRTAAP